MTPRKADQPQLTRAQIVRAALALIDEHGVEGQSMRRLGAELGVDASTLYYHLPNKAALYDLVVDEVMSAVDFSGDDEAASLEDRVLAAATAYRAALLRHPRAVPLVAVRTLRTPAQLRVIERFSGIFVAAGFSPAEALIAIDACGMAVLGMANVHAAAMTAPAQALHPDGVVADPAGAAEGLSPDEFPNLARMLPEAGAAGPDVEFDRAMRALAIGLRAQHEAGTLAPVPAGGAGSPAPATAPASGARKRARKGGE